MRTLIALIFLILLGATSASCVKSNDHMYAGIAVAYVNGKMVDTEFFGLALTKEKCERGIKDAAKVQIPNDGTHYVLGCAEVIPLASVN